MCIIWFPLSRYRRPLRIRHGEGSRCPSVLRPCLLTQDATALLSAKASKVVQALSSSADSAMALHRLGFVPLLLATAQIRPPRNSVPRPDKGYATPETVWHCVEQSFLTLSAMCISEVRKIVLNHGNVFICKISPPILALPRFVAFSLEFLRSRESLVAAVSC